MNDIELDVKIEEVETLRKQVKNNQKAMEYYNHLKTINNGDVLYSWMFSNDDILEEDLIDFCESYQKRYCLDVLTVYRNELENILIKSEL